MTSSPRFRIFQANATDEERLRQLYSEKSRDGAIQINLDRTPNFVDALQVEGFENGIFSVEDTQTGVIVGTGIRNIRKCFINGKFENVGYLSGLRVASTYRKSRAMAMIFIKLRQLYLKGECKGYLCSVFNSNKAALEILTSGKAGMPTFKRVGQLNTFIFKPKQIHSNINKNILIRRLETNDIDKFLKFLHSEGSKRQFFPYYTHNDLTNSSGLLKDLHNSDIIIAIEENEIISCLALWNQNTFRRWKVEGYSAGVKILRPFLNGIFSLLTLPRLPKEHSKFNYRLLSLVCIRDNDRNIFAELFNYAIHGLDKKEAVLISASFFENDSLIQVLPKFKFSFKSTILLGFWKETKSEIDQIDQRFPYIEAGSL